MKKVKYSTDFDSTDRKHSAVIRVKRNDLLKVISDYSNLTIINLSCTKVEKIENCPILYSLRIAHNQGLNNLELNTVEDLYLESAVSLTCINMPMVKQATLKHLPRLSSIILPKAIEVYMNNIDFSKAKVKPIYMPEVRTLRLKNLKGVKTQDAFNYAMNLSTLIIDNCDLVCLNKLDNYDQVVIQNCKSLQMISNITNIRRLTIDNCPRLFSCENMTDMGSIVVSRCDALVRFKNTEAANITFEYCFALTELNLSMVEYIEVNRCPSFSRFTVQPELQQLTFNQCGFLDEIIFTQEYVLSGTELSLEIIGDNMIEGIDDWWVSRLSIKENQTLKYITHINNLNYLALEDCHELCSIAHAIVSNDIKIHCCSSLESIYNIDGFQSLSITDCDSLIDLRVKYSNATKMIIKNCLDLNFTFNGFHLEKLILEDVGVALISHITPSAKIRISNVSMLPDLVSENINDEDNSPEDSDSEDLEEYNYPASMILKSHFMKMNDACKIIYQRIKTFKIRRAFLKYTQLQREKDLCDCVICQEAISFQTGTFTNCNHLFHRDCLSTWMAVRRTCPLCNNTM